MVNLSARQFHERGLADTVTATLRDVGLDARHLVLEITESLIMKNTGVIAEGVETQAQLAFLRSLKCEAMQGYIFSRPLPAAEFEQLLRRGRRLPEAA